MAHALRPLRARIATVLSIALALCAGALLLAVPGTAGAASTCDMGEFCLWQGYNEIASTSGLYTNAGNDADLSNNYFMNKDTSVIVNNQASSLWNNGRYDDVLVYDGKSYSGGSLCIKRTARITGLGVGWFFDNRISSFRWVKSC